MLISSVWRGGESRLYFVLGLMVGGTLTGAVASIVGAIAFQWWFPEQLAAWAAVTVGVVAIARDAGWVDLPLPQNARQVPELVSGLGPRQGAIQFGLEMGTGARTFMTSMLPFVPLAFVVLGAPWESALLCGLAFGVGRGAVPVVRALRENDESWSTRFLDRERSIQVALGVTTTVGLLVNVLPLG